MFSKGCEIFSSENGQKINNRPSYYLSKYGAQHII